MLKHKQSLCIPLPIKLPYWFIVCLCNGLVGAMHVYFCLDRINQTDHDDEKPVIFAKDGKFEFCFNKSSVLAFARSLYA
nr:hypothetical protein [Tanacetum cinerariifolium]